MKDKELVAMVRVRDLEKAVAAILMEKNDANLDIHILEYDAYHDTYKEVAIADLNSYKRYFKT